MAIKTRQKPKSAQHRKRTGQHHNHGKAYLKTYWPYLPLLAIVSLGFLINGVWSSQMRGVEGYSTNVSPSSLLADTNSQRATNSESGLTISSELNAAAQAKANDMVQRDYWSHVTPNGVQPWQFITSHGYQYKSAGENLAYGFASSSDVLTAWMNSPEHRANILDAKYQNVGFGIANSPNYQGNGSETIVVAEYGQPAAIATTASAPVQPLAAPGENLPPSQHVARIQLLSGGDNWTLFLVTLVASVAALIFILRHALAFKKLVAEGESFVLHHHYLDVAVVSLAVAGVVLTRTVGVIH